MGKNVRAILQSASVPLTAGIGAQMNARSAQAPEISHHDDRLTGTDNPAYLFIPTPGVGTTDPPRGVHFLQDHSFPSTVPDHRELNNSLNFLNVCMAFMALSGEDVADPLVRNYRSWERYHGVPENI